MMALLMRGEQVNVAPRAWRGVHTWGQAGQGQGGTGPPEQPLGPGKTGPGWPGLPAELPVSALPALPSRQSLSWFAIAGSVASKSRRRHERDAWGCLLYPELKREERHRREHDHTL